MLSITYQIDLLKLEINIKRGKIMKKYTVIYNGKEYEVRWSTLFYVDYLTIYEIKKIFGIKYRTEIYSEKEDTINKILNNIDKSYKDDPNYYIEEIKCLFRQVEIENDIYKTKSKQKQALKEWDGVIDTK